MPSLLPLPLSLLLLVSFLLSSPGSFSLSAVSAQSAQPLVVSPYQPAPAAYYLVDPPVAADLNAVITFSWWMPFQNLDWLQAEYEAVSDPASPRYLDFKPVENITAMVNPSQSDVVAPVIAYLTNGTGIPAANISQVNAQLVVTTQVSIVQSLFNVTLQLYRLNSSAVRDGEVVRASELLRTNESIVIPSHVAPHLQLLNGVNDLPTRLVDLARQSRKRFAARRSNRTSAANSSSSSHHFHPMSAGTELTCQSDLTAGYYQTGSTPYFIARQCGYNPQSTASVPANQVRLAVLGGFLGIYYNPTDLDKYVHDLGYTITSPSISPLFDNLGSNAANAEGEGSLDMDMAFAYCPQCSIGQLEIPQTNQNAGLHDIYNAVLALPSGSQPHITSASFGDDEADYNSNPGFTTTETILQQLATAGVTNLASSGDAGANSYGCTYGIRVVYPASSAYVLAVGATEYYNGVTNYADSCAFDVIPAQNAYQYPTLVGNDLSGSNNLMCGQCANGGGLWLCQIGTKAAQRAVNPAAETNAVPYTSGFASGGGFSRYIAQPAAQSAAITGYLAACTTANNCHLPTSGYNTANRGIPDVSFYGSGTQVGLNGYYFGEVGTSESSPAFAGVLANLLQYYQTATGTTVGFGDVKGLLYSAQAATAASPGPLQAFSDVTVGDNVCPGDGYSCPSSCKGYYTAPGWDPVTGLGTPYLPALTCYLATVKATPDVVAQCAYAASGASYVPFGSNLCNTDTSAAPTVVPGAAMSSSAASSSTGDSSSSAAAPSYSFSSSSSSANAAIYSDPYFSGFWGQTFYAHGRPAAVYSLISDSTVQLLARFVFLQNVTCPVLDEPAQVHCSSHPGTYFGEVALTLHNGERLHIVAGDVAVGFTSVTVNSQLAVAVNDTYGSLNVEQTHSSRSSLYVHRRSARSLIVHAGVYELLIENSDQYVDLVWVRVTNWTELTDTLRPTGLLGRTWDWSASMELSAAMEDEYREKDDDLHGCNTQHDQFCSSTQHTKPAAPVAAEAAAAEAAIQAAQAALAAQAIAAAAVAVADAPPTELPQRR